MRSDAIFAVWHQGKVEYVERIERELRNRLLGTNSLVNGIRERLAETGKSLFAWPPKFKLPSAFDHRHPALSRLAFVTRHESIMAYLGIRERRMAPLAERLLDGETLRLTYLGDDRFQLDPSQQDREDRQRYVSQLDRDRGGRRKGPSPGSRSTTTCGRDRPYAPNNLPHRAGRDHQGRGVREYHRPRAARGREARPSLPAVAAGSAFTSWSKGSPIPHRESADPSGEISTARMILLSPV